MLPDSEYGKDGRFRARDRRWVQASRLLWRCVEAMNFEGGRPRGVRVRAATLLVPENWLERGWL